MGHRGRCGINPYENSGHGSVQFCWRRGRTHGPPDSSVSATPLANKALRMCATPLANKFNKALSFRISHSQLFQNLSSELRENLLQLHINCLYGCLRESNIISERSGRMRLQVKRLQKFYFSCWNQISSHRRSLKINSVKRVFFYCLLVNTSKQHSSIVHGTLFFQTRRKFIFSRYRKIRDFEVRRRVFHPQDDHNFYFEMPVKLKPVKLVRII